MKTLVLSMLVTGCILFTIAGTNPWRSLPAKQPAQTETLLITSSAFAANKYIPQKYSCEGSGVNPPLAIGNIPNGAKSLALIVDDPDAPMGTFDHWLAWNIAPVGSIVEHSAPGVQGLNGSGRPGYMGPCPPDDKPHRYFFKVYALDVLLGLKANSEKKDLQREMQGHILAEGVLVGLYKKTR